MWSLRPVQHWTWARRGNWVGSRPCPRSTTDGVTVVKQLCQFQPMGFVPSFSSSFSCSFFTLFFSWLYLGRGTWSYSQTTWLISSTASMWPWNGLKHSSQNQNQKWTRFIATFRVLERLCKVISMSMINSTDCPTLYTDFSQVLLSTSGVAKAGSGRACAQPKAPCSSRSCHAISHEAHASG